MQVTASIEGDRAMGFVHELQFLLHPSEKKSSKYYNQGYTWNSWYFTNLSTVQMALLLTSQQAFTGHAISLQIPFKLLKIQQASCLLSIILWPLSPHFISDESQTLSLPNQGTLLSGKIYWAIYALDQKPLKCTQKHQVRKRKGQLHKDVIGKELVAKSLG